MAKVNVTYSCGHQARLDGRNRTECDRKEAWAKTTVCWACDQAAISEHAAQKAADAGLPTLTGSEKQVRWAETLRQGAIAEFDTLAAALIDGLTRATNVTPDMIEERRDALALLRNEMIARDQARVWIDDRDTRVSAQTIRVEMEQRHLCPLNEARILAVMAAKAAEATP